MCQVENQLITLTIGLKKPELNKMHILIYSSKNLFLIQVCLLKASRSTLMVILRLGTE